MHPRPTLHHLRETHGRQEVDLEFKAGATPDAGDARHLRWLHDKLGDDFLAGAVLHSGPGMYELSDRVYAVPLCALWG